MVVMLNRVMAYIPGLLIVYFYLLGLFTFPYLASNKQLCSIKKVYVAREELEEVNERFIAKESRINTVLREELERGGLIVVREIADADAVIRGSFGDVVVVDGPAFDPPKYYYEYQLTSREGKVLWQTKITIRSRSNEAELDKKAAAKVSERLLKAYRKAVKKAA